MSAAGGAAPLGNAFVKRVRRGDFFAEEFFVEVPLFESDTVSSIAKRSCEECAWGVRAYQIQLYLVKAVSIDGPSSREMEVALAGKPLLSPWTLLHAGVAKGAFLLALVPDPVVSPGEFSACMCTMLMFGG
jgi:hypothetical protein